MREALLVITGISLLLAAAGLLLWQWAKGRQSREATGRHLDQRIQASAAVSAAVPLPLRDPIGESDGSRITTDPWMEAEVDRAAATRRGPLEVLLPGWLEGVVKARTLLLIGTVILAACVASALFGGWPAAIGCLLSLTLIATFLIWLRLQKFRRQLIGQLPAFIDSMVRLITIGNSTQAAFQLAIGPSQMPLKGLLENAAGLVRAGVDLDRALLQTAANVRIEEMYLLASTLGLGVRYGGRADLLLERISNFMRDHAQAEHELIAMSSETRMSAWILGLLPVGVGGFIIMFNPEYFLRMWHDGTGQTLIFGAVGLQVFGGLLLYRMARLS